MITAIKTSFVIVAITLMMAPVAYAQQFIERTVTITEYAVGTSTPSNCFVKYMTDGKPDAVTGIPTALAGEAICAALLVAFSNGDTIKIED